jgi:hypothetical protein
MSALAPLVGAKRTSISAVDLLPRRRAPWAGLRALVGQPATTDVEIVSCQAYAWLMKLALIAIGLFAITGQASLAFARGGGLHLLDPPLNPQHINGLPAEVRNAVAHRCRNAQAEHQFAGYSQNSQKLVLHFERLHCGDHGAFCTQAGCLHQVYVPAGGHYRLLKSYYAPAGD